MYSIIRLVQKGFVAFEATTFGIESGSVQMRIRYKVPTTPCIIIYGDPSPRSALSRVYLHMQPSNDEKSAISCNDNEFNTHTMIDGFNFTQRNMYLLQRIQFDGIYSSEYLNGSYLSLMEGFLDRLMISNETLASWNSSSVVGCTFLYEPRGSTIAESVAYLVLSLIGVLVNIRICGDLLLNSISSSILLKSTANHLRGVLKDDDCGIRLIDPIFTEFLWSDTLGFPPLIDPCLLQRNAADFIPVPWIASVGNFSSVNSYTRAISVGSFYGNQTIIVGSPPPTICPVSTSSVLVDCDELPNSKCDIYGGCFVLWGPCQTVADGYYSPSGSLNQIPCARSIGTHEQYVPSSAQIFCQSLCIPAGKFYRASNESCTAVPVGYMVDPCDERKLINCGFDKMTGIIPVLSTNCSGRAVTSGLGLPSAIRDTLPITLESWIKLNTKLIREDLLLLGVVGYVFLGIRNLSESSFALFFYGNSVTDQRIIVSDPFPHLDGTQWVHVAVVATIDSSCMFYINGVSAGNVRVTRGAFFSLASSLRNELNQAVIPLIGLIHYGPIKFLASDFYNTSPVPGLLIFSPSDHVSPSFQLFNPRILDKQIAPLALGFFGIVPPDYPRPMANVNTSAMLADIPQKFSWLTCKNYCASNHTNCVPDCTADKVFNPDTCECVPRPTKAAVPTTNQVAVSTPISSSSLASASSGQVLSQPSDPPAAVNSAGIIVICISIFSLACLSILWLVRRRRVVKIGASKRRGSSDFFDPFADITTVYYSPN